MPYWMPDGRTLLWWALAIGLGLFVVHHPAQAGSAVGHLARWLAWVAGQLAKFVESI